ncbi:carbohydrate ABC transporter permease [Kitasatospora sp. NPDC059648]|uniref:carbohydrate ABC transporter permease n=1 Tax=Kitasatospora sp. NPDC059648 TaxID=3346894 RepID=UPI0036981E62
MAVNPGRRRAGARGLTGAGPFTYAVLILVAVLSLFPLYWTLVGASTSGGRIAQTPPPLLPGGNLWHNLDIAWNQVHMGRALLNSVVVASCVTVSTVLFATLAGFAFAKLPFRGRSALLSLVVATMMVPAQLSVIPLYQIMARLHWTDQLQSVILPNLVAAFGVFFMRQFLSEALPIELVEAARTDGASSLRILWSVVLPIARPGMAVLGMLVFVQSWNDFFWPLIALSQSNPTVQVALAGLGGGSYDSDQAVILTGSLLGTAPLLLVFALLGRQVVGGITAGAVKN